MYFCNIIDDVKEWDFACLRGIRFMNSRAKQNWFIAFLIAAALLVLAAAVTVKENKYNPTLGDGTISIIPTQIDKADAVTDVYTIAMPELDETNNTLLFYTNHMEILVYADEELIYSLEKDTSMFGRTPGAMWNIMNLPIDTKELKIHTTPAYPSLAQQDIEFQLGNAISMERAVVHNTVIDVCVCLCILMIGVGLFFYWLMVFRKTNEEKELLYLGMFAWVFGTWAFGETQLAVFMFDHRAYWSYMAFTCLMVMCLPFLFFVQEFMETNDKYFHKFIAIYIVVETIVAQFLHLTGLVSVKETVLFTIASIVLTISYLLYAIISAIRRKKNKRKIIANILGLMALVITAVVDMSGYFTNVSKANQLGKVGFLVYAVILGVETARIAQERVQENHKAILYREMAHKDIPTGCFNRNAYAEDTSKGFGLDTVMLIVFDLNNLKKCNDTRGHRAGDKYIADAAHMIQEVFEGLGKIYRIGGDEFCIITRNIPGEVIQQRRENLKEEILRYRRETGDTNFGIACGYAMFDREADKDIEETRHRADLWMYENKKEIKAAN